jgi:UPF0755 protein
MNAPPPGKPEIVRRTWRRIFLGLAILTVSGFLAVLFCFNRLTSSRSVDPKWHTFEIQKGDTLKKVSSNLKAKGIISHPFLFQMAGRIKGYDGMVRAGEYRLSTSMSALDILEKLKKGEVVTRVVTIPEGYNLNQIADLLDENGISPRENFLKFARNPQTLEQLGLWVNTLEGYLYPDTYRFYRNTPIERVVQVMVDRFWEMVSPLTEKIEKSHMTLEQIITLASMVEKETGSSNERPIIAGVFINRLRKKMRLESDPTVIYGIKNFDGNITRNDLKVKTPYNTYVIRGLPAGPIANPGIAAIKAVLEPTGEGFYYFVSKNDGTHYFSKTLGEHNRAVRKYQKNRTGHQS